MGDLASELEKKMDRSYLHGLLKIDIDTSRSDNLLYPFVFYQSPRIPHNCIQETFRGFLLPRVARLN